MISNSYSYSNSNSNSNSNNDNDNDNDNDNGNDNGNDQNLYNKLHLSLKNGNDMVKQTQYQNKEIYKIIRQKAIYQ